MTRSAESFRLVLAGQSLIERPLTATTSLGQVRDIVRRADLAITNLEAAVKTVGGWPVRDTTTHVAPESVLDSLSWLGFNAVALASNHAFDLGPPGVVAALDATRARGMLTAGTGLDAIAAKQPGLATVAGRRVALVGVVAAPNPPGAHALNARDGLPARPGVNLLRVKDEGDGADSGGVTPDESDVETLLDDVRRAISQADVVVAYLHNHWWADPQDATPDWVRTLARQCVDEGASVFLGHGTPVMQGLEFYRGHLIAYGLGSLVFHTHKPQRYQTAAWESALVELVLSPDGAARDVRLRPIVHGAHPDLRDQEQADGAPILATATRAREIATRLDELSQPFGVSIAAGEDGVWRVAPAPAARERG